MADGKFDPVLWNAKELVQLYDGKVRKYERWLADPKGYKVPDDQIGYCQNKRDLYARLLETAMTKWQALRSAKEGVIKKSDA